MLLLRKEMFTAYIIFTGADHGIWWRLFTKRGYRHVQLIIPQPNNNSLFGEIGPCILINALSFTVSVSIIYKSIDDIIIDAKNAKATKILAFPVRKVFTREFVPRGILTCVSLIKAVIGVNDFRIVTPEQLYRWLIKNGAKEV